MDELAIGFDVISEPGTSAWRQLLASPIQPSMAGLAYGCLSRPLVWASDTSRGKFQCRGRVDRAHLSESVLYHWAGVRAALTGCVCAALTGCRARLGCAALRVGVLT